MNKHRYAMMILVCALALVAVTGCATTAAPTATPAKAPTAAAPASAPKSAEPAASSKEPIVIGVVAETTGPQVQAGEAVIAAAKLAAEEWNAKGGVKGRPVEVSVEDTASNPSGAVNGFNKLVASKKPVGIVASIFTNFVMAFEPYLKQARIPVITGASAAVVTSAGDGWFFRIAPSDPLNVRLAVDYAVKDLGIKKLGIIYVTGEFGQGGAKLLTESLEKAGVKPVGAESYNAEDKDLTGQLLNLDRAGAELVFGWSYSTDAALVMTTVQQLGLKMKIIGNNAYHQPEALKLAGPAAEGVYSVNIWYPDNKPETQAWMKKIQPLQKQPPNYINTEYYDGTNILLKAIETAGTDSQAVRQAILATKGYKGLTGEYNFDEKGDGLHQVNMAQTKGGDLVVLKAMKE